MNPLVTIIGGAGAVGELYAELFDKNGYKVAILDSNQTVAEMLAKEKGYIIADEETVEKSDIVIFSVPIDKTEQAIEEYAPLIKEYAWAMDTTSVKIKPMQALLDNTGEYVNILGTHPMFRPTIGFNKQNVAFIEERIFEPYNDIMLQDIYDMFTNDGAQIIERTADRHDQMMAIIQGLSHMQNLIFTNSIEKSNFDIKELDLVSTPVYNMLLDSALRMLAGDPRLPALIQIKNPYCKPLISDIKKIYGMIEDYIDREDVDGLTEFISDIKEYVGKFAEEASQRTDKLIGEPRFVAEIYFERQDMEKMSKIYKGTRNHKELNATLYEPASKRDEKAAKNTFIPDEEKDIMTATILAGDVSRFIEQDDIITATEKKWTMLEFQDSKKTVFYIDKNIDYREKCKKIPIVSIITKPKYKKIAMASIITKPKKLKKKEKQYNRKIIPLRHLCDDDIVSFFHTFRTDKILKENKRPKIIVKYPHKSTKKKNSKK